MKGLYRIASLAVVSLIQFATAHECMTKYGIEANFEDEGCETFWECRDFAGVALKKCPDGGQFDFKENQCRQNGEVWCQWQHQQLEEQEGRQSSDMRRDRVRAKNTHRALRPRNHGPRSRNTLSNKNNNYYYTDSSHSSSNAKDGGYVDYETGGSYDYYTTNNNNNNVVRNFDKFYDDLDQWTYVCRSEWGHEPNLNDPNCRSFWRCDRFKGSLIECKPGHIYDYSAKACRHHSQVGCHEQHHKHINSQPKHRVEVKTNPDGRTTLVHHYYYDNK